MPSTKKATKTKGGDLHTVKRKVKNTIKDVMKVVKGEQPLSLKRKVSEYPPKVRELLAKIGHEQIKSLTVARAPLQTFVKKLLNVLSWGAYESAVKSSGYDSMFHLSLIINGSYRLEKLAVVSLVQGGTPEGAETEGIAVLGRNITIQELVDKTRDYMGARAFSNYNAHTNNCQVFIRSILEANGLLTDKLKSFIMQDADSVFQKMPSVTEQLAKFVTDIGATADVIVEGQGKPKKKAKTIIKKPDESKMKWAEFVGHRTRGKKFGRKEEAQENLRKLSEEYKALKTKQS